VSIVTLILTNNILLYKKRCRYIISVRDAQSRKMGKPKIQKGVLEQELHGLKQNS